MNKFTIELFGATDTGRLRTNNEDSFIAETMTFESGAAFSLCVAIDGVGGYEGGEVASAIASDTIRDDIFNLQPFVAVEDDPLERLKSAVVDANNRIVERKQFDTRLSEMGCVLSAGLFDLLKGKFYLAHIGDSRIYILKKGRLVKLTHDHSPVGRLEDEGLISEYDAMHHPRRNVISKMVGDSPLTGTEEDFIECSSHVIEGESLYLFCSDGLTDLVPAAEISGILADPATTLEEKCTLLIDRANEIMGKDNITVILAKCNPVAETLAEPVAGCTKAITRPVANADSVSPAPDETSAQPSDLSDTISLSKPLLALIIVLALALGFVCGCFCRHIQLIRQPAAVSIELATPNDSII